MKKKSVVYRHYLIEWESLWSDYDKWYNEGFNAFIGLTRAFGTAFPTINRTKVAIDLWIKFHMNPPKFWRYARHLLVTNRHNYSGCYGKLISVSRLKQIARGA